MDGIALDGDAVTPISPDTSKTAPSSLKVTSGPAQIRLPGEWQSDYYTSHGNEFAGAGASVAAWLRVNLNAAVFSRKTYTNVFPDVGISNAIGFQSSTMDECLMFQAASGSGIVVKPGQGLALVSGRTSATGEFPLLGASSTFHNYDIEATILYYPPPAAPSGGNTYSKSRVVNRM